MLPRLLTTAERVEIEQLKAQADALLDAAPITDITSFACEIVAEYAAQLGENVLPVKIIAYSEALTGLPLHACIQARKWWWTGQMGANELGADKGFAPAPAALRSLAEKALDAAKVRKGQMITLLKARARKKVEVPADVRERSAALARQVAAAIGGREAPSRRTRPIPAAELALVDKIKRGEKVTDEMVDEAQRGVVIH